VHYANLGCQRFLNPLKLPVSIMSKRRLLNPNADVSIRSNALLEKAPNAPLSIRSKALLEKAPKAPLSIRSKARFFIPLSIRSNALFCLLHDTRVETIVVKIKMPVKNLCSIFLLNILR